MVGRVNRKDFFYVVILILTFITVIVGAAFALFSFVYSQDEGKSAIYTGTLSIEYLSGDIINCYYLYPTDNPLMTDDKNVYKNTFKVRNTGSLDSLLKININLNSNEFSDGTLMYSIYNSSGEELASGYIGRRDTTIIANDIELKSNSTEEFTLIIWIKESGENQNSEMKKSLNGTIQVDASQKLTY